LTFTATASILQAIQRMAGKAESMIQKPLWAECQHDLVSRFTLFCQYGTDGTLASLILTDP